MEYSSFIEKFTASLSKPKEINKGTIRYMNNVQELIVRNIDTQELTNTGQYYNSDNNLSQEDLLSLAYDFYTRQQTS